jgi:uncharacterized membrane protein
MHQLRPRNPDPHRDRAGRAGPDPVCNRTVRPSRSGLSQELAVLLLSGLGTGASWLCYFRALKLGPATPVAPIDKLSVVLVALFGWPFWASGLRFKAGIDIVLIATGAVLIAVKA